MAGPAVGDAAPDFTLAGTGGRDYTLAAYRGQPVLLVFYPGDNTPVCTMQLNSYNDDLGQFQGLGAQVLAISPQSVASHERFCARHGFAFPLLADEGKAVFAAYGCVGPLGFPRRSVFVIDPEGVIALAQRSTVGLTFARTPALVAAIEAAGGQRLH